MKLAARYWLSVLVMSLIWILLTAIFLGTVSNRSMFNRVIKMAQTKDPVYKRTFVDKVTNASSTGRVYEKDDNLYQLLKAAWPPKAKPDDAGYGGDGVSINRSLLTEREKVIYDNGLKIFNANLLASDRVALRRNIVLDMPECQNITYDTANLPSVGIVVIFIDEMWSAIMRTVFSILDAGPEELITEIVLVDDASQKDHLGISLSDYIRIFGGKVKLVRLPERKGLMMARNIGSEHVTGEVVIFLDGHCEVSKGWLEPLLHRIQQDDSVIAIPQHDNLNYETFKYSFTNNSNHHMCGFEFDMNFNWISMPPVGGNKRRNVVDPVATPTHLGCCLATSKRNFERLGRYDPGLEIWGCENLEISFKAWMCWGRVEIIPCSHIAHMFKRFLPFTWVGKPHIKERNCLRVAEAWMDQYKVFYYDRLSDSQRAADIGDVSDMKALKEKLKCRSFDWYLKEVYPEFYVPINTTAIGRVTNVRYPSVCMEKNLQKDTAQDPSASDCKHYTEGQYFYLTKEKQIRRDSHCLSYDKKESHFLSHHCNNHHGTWTYSQDNLIRAEGTDLCMAMLNSSWIGMATCNSSDSSQQWNWPRKSLIAS